MNNVNQEEETCTCNIENNKHCTKCEYYMNCNWNHIGLGSGSWAKECIDYQLKE